LAVETAFEVPKLYRIKYTRSLTHLGRR